MVVGKGILMNWYYYKHVGLDIGRFWKAIGRIAVAFVVPLGAAIAMTLFIPMTDVWVILLCGVGIAALEAVFLWVFGMNNDDRAQLLGPLGRVLKRR